MNFELFALPFGLKPEDVVVIFTGVMTFAAVLGLALGVPRRDPLASRLRAVSSAGARPSSGGPRAVRGAGRAGAVGLMRGIVNRFHLLRSREAQRIALKLAQAGWRSKDVLVVYLFAKLSLPLATGALALGLFSLLEAELPGLVRLAAVLVCVLGASVFPDLVVRNAAIRRRQKIRRALPDCLDLLVICAEAGLSLDAGLARVAREIGRSAPELADELGVTVFELGFLPERRQALENLRARAELPGVQSLVGTLQQTEKYGTALAQSLRVLASEQRAERMLRAEEKASRLPAIMTVPLILFVLPALFVVVLGPGLLDIIDALARF